MFMYMWVDGLCFRFFDEWVKCLRALMYFGSEWWLGWGDMGRRRECACGAFSGVPADVLPSRRDVVCRFYAFSFVCRSDLFTTTAIFTIYNNNRNAIPFMRKTAPSNSRD